MGDQTLELVGENGNLVAGCQYETPTLSEEEFKESRDSIGVSGDSDDTQLSSIDEEEPRLPILKKIDVMETKIRKLRKEHATLSNEVKDMTSNEFPGSEILNTLQHISADHELLKKQHAEECGVLKQKYLEECAERKRLYNEVIELKGNIRVFCRCRPLNQDEIASGCTSVTEFDSSQENKLQITSADHSKKEFKFDHVFGPEDNQESVFSQTSPVVTSVLDGYNVCIFAYGQTGTGKTFTMEGTSENRGVNYRTLEELFRISNERSRKMRYEVFVSMLEVYNEKIRDLLAENSTQPAQKLEVKQGAEGTQEVPGLVEARVYNTDEVWELLKKGNRARSVGSTNANEFSSRSHCLLRVTVKGEELVNKMGTKSNLWLVDLAGSERVGKIEAEGERLKESQFINKSLSALGDVIAALASKAAHVPYRNSKLTHILQSSLGGDCKTLMFVQISPSSSDLGETLCSLNFASRVRGIENGPAHKHVDHLELLKYKQMAEKVKHDEKEMKKLQDSVQSLQLRLSAREHVCRNLQDKVRDLENQLAQERKLRLKEGKPVPGPATDNDKPSKLLTKPPLGGFQLRPPLRQINTFLPPSRPPLQSQSNKTATHFSRRSSSGTNKENSLEGVTHARKPMLEPRRVTIALRPSPSMPSSQSSKAIMQPRRRVSVATPMQENNASYMSSSQRSKPQTMMQPRRRVSIATPMQKNNNSFIRTPMRVVADEPSRRLTSATKRQNNNSFIRTPMRVVADEPSRRLTSATKRQSFFRDPVRVKRYSKLFSPSQAVAATPVSVNKSSSRFMASPPTQLGSWKPKHPTVIALQKKHVLWSPLRSKGLKSQRQRQSSIFP